jgi:type IV pilus assembly protein PilW
MKPARFHFAARPTSHLNLRGMTLIELMVAMAIGLGVMLAVTTLLIAGERHKRVTTSTNDAEQTGAYVFHALDGLLRGAGSAIAESAYPSDRGVLGCVLNVAGILPRTSAFPAPFTNVLSGVTNTLVVAPLLIAPGASDSGSDVLIVMGGSGAAGGVSRQVTGGGSATSMTLDNAVGFSVGDMALVSQSGVPQCLMEQVSSLANIPTVNVGGTYYTLNGVAPAAPSTSLTALVASTSTYVTPLGNSTANNLQFEMIGVGTNRTLYTYDLLQNLTLVQNLTNPEASQAIADGVQGMYAIYGVDSSGNHLQQNAWASPGTVGGDGIYTLANVMASPNTMQNILAVRVALVLRSEYYDKNNNTFVSPPTLTLFNGYVNAAGNSLTRTITLSVTDRQYRYRVFEFTVPLRNMLLLAGA